MMEDARRPQILEMRAEGIPYRVIAEQFGISRQRAQQIAAREPMDIKRFHIKAVAKIPYVGLRTWMINNRVSTSELSRRCGVERLPLSGQYKLKTSTANKILQATGLTFEECFRREDIDG